MTPYEMSRAAFNKYAGMDEPFLPDNEVAACQVLFARWVNTKVKHTLPGSVENVLGLAEEAGELHAAIGKLAHLELNLSQGRRYSKLTDEQVREEAADAVADIGIFLMNYCTTRRLDFVTLLLATAKQVLQRDWLTRPDDAHIATKESK